MARLDLQPAGAAPARLVGRVEGLHHDALVALRQRRLQDRRRGRRRPRPPSAAPGAASGTAASSTAKRSAPGRSSRSSPSACSTSKNSGVSRASAGRPRARAGSRSPGTAPAARRRAARSPRRRAPRRASGSASAASTTSGTPRGDVVEAARERPRTSPSRRWTWIRTPSSLHSTAAGRDLRQRRLDVRRGRGEHRLQRAGRPRAGRLAAPARRRSARSPPRRRRSRAQHQGAPHRLHRHAPRPARPPRPSRRPARPGAGRRAAAATRNSCSVSVARREQLVQRGAAATACEPGAARAADALARRVDLDELERRLGGRRAAGRAATPSPRRSGAGAARPTGTRRRSRPPPAPSGPARPASVAIFSSRAEVAPTAAEVSTRSRSSTAPRYVTRCGVLWPCPTC